jgi:Flp pilus assembly pilin Flp
MSTNSLRRVRDILMDETGGPYSEYALLASVFAVVMIAMMVLVQDSAAGQLTYTDGSLNNRNGVSP